MRILGIDFSTFAVDFVLIDEDGTPEWWHYPLIGSDAFDRARNVRDALPARSSVLYDDVLAAGIEEPAGMGTKQLFRIQGAVIACLPSRLLVEKWMPSSWRKAVGIPGNASKLDVEKWVVRRCLDLVKPPETGETVEFPLWPQDACDAYCIAEATGRAIRHEAAA